MAQEHRYQLGQIIYLTFLREGTRALAGTGVSGLLLLIFISRIPQAVAFQKGTFVPAPPTQRFLRTRRAIVLVASAC